LGGTVIGPTPPSNQILPALALKHLGWRRASEQDRQDLARWLVARAVEHDAPSVLIALTPEHLRPRRIPRPPLEVLTRMISTARAEAYREIEALLADQLAPERRDELHGRRHRAPPHQPAGRQSWGYRAPAPRAAPADPHRWKPTNRRPSRRRASNPSSIAVRAGSPRAR
jgi:Domain of unknown function (DUF4158)